MRTVSIVLCLVLISFSNGPRARAVDLVQIVVDSTSMDVTDSYKDISVTLFNPLSEAVNIASFSLKLHITPTSPRQVEFDAATQPDTLNETFYIFSGNSAAFDDATSPWSVASDGGVNDVYTFADTTSDTLNVSIGAGESKLLAKVRLKPGTALGGDIYGLGIVSTGTELIDADFAIIDFAGIDGVITVVPEPGAGLLGTLSCAAILAFRRRRDFEAGAG